jgi:hypothetical protein
MEVLRINIGVIMQKCKYVEFELNAEVVNVQKY